MGRMSDPFFFGYGSLVNRRTHAYPEAMPARVTGWRRAWRKSPGLERCILSVVEAETDYVEGLVAAVPGADWAALDLRERHYARHDVSHRVRHGIGRDVNVAIYAADPAVFQPPADDDILLLSYIDVVVQGFLSEFGPEGVAHFFDSTDGWNAAVIDDRAAPVYPRHQALGAEERDTVDRMLDQVGARVLRA